ncbi:MAG: DUF2914 domain-containing protein [Bacteriovoracaceae bacterium]|nr:DUF2914 domain-containing protein [Bacteriovoracaceae bacterium]
MKLSKYKLLKIYVKNKQFLPAIFFLSGFLFDVLTLGRIDDLSNILMQILYLGAAFLTLSMEVTDRHKSSSDIRPVQLFIQYHDEIYHFLAGGLLSIYTLFFFKSSSLASSLLFLFLMFFILIINEFESVKKTGKTMRMILFFICLTCFSFLITPLIMGKVGVVVFLVSLVIAALLSLMVIFAWSHTTKTNLKSFIVPPSTVIGIFALLYLVKLIPPIPLAIEKIGIYHNVQKDLSRYHLHHQRPWWKLWHNGDQDFKAGTGDKVYIFARIFSPGGFKEKVILNWQTKVDGDWKTSDKIPMQITGGRSEGFRGFAYKSNYTSGDWRVLVESNGGREIGRINFEIEKIEGDSSNFKVEIDE